MPGKSNLADALEAGLAQRNLEREPIYWMALTEAEAQELADGVVPDEVRSMAAWLCEPLHEMVEKKQRQRKQRDAELLAAQAATNGTKDAGH